MEEEDVYLDGLTALRTHKVLSTISLSRPNITQLAEWMIKFRSLTVALVKSWVNEFETVQTDDQKLALMHLADEVLERSAQLNIKDYKCMFSRVFERIFNNIGRTINNNDHLRDIYQLLRKWEDNCYVGKFDLYNYRHIVKQRILINDGKQIKVRPLIFPSYTEYVYTDPKELLTQQMITELEKLKKYVGYEDNVVLVPSKTFGEQKYVPKIHDCPIVPIAEHPKQSASFTQRRALMIKLRSKYKYRECTCAPYKPPLLMPQIQTFLPPLPTPQKLFEKSELHNEIVKTVTGNSYAKANANKQCISK